MGIVEELHKEHQERQYRIQKAAIKPLPKPALSPPTTIEQMPKIGGSTFDVIMREVCDYYNVSQSNILSDRRLGKIVNARHMLVFLLYRLTNMTTYHMGKKLSRDHSSIGYVINKMEMGIARYTKELGELETRITAILNRRKALLAPQRYAIEEQREGNI